MADDFEDFDFTGFSFKPATREITFGHVDPEVLALLTGDPVTGDTFAMEVWSPIKRTFWQWLRRRPRQYNRTYFPRAQWISTVWKGDEGA